MPSNGLPVLPLPLQQRVVDVRDLLTVPWTMLFRQMLAGMAIPTYAQGTHEERVGDPTDPDDLGMPPSGFRSGAFFWETDRTVLYQNQAVPNDPGDPDAGTHMEWVYVAGTMRADLADKPTDLVNLSAPTPLPKDRVGNDTGFLFYGIDYAHTWRWTGSGWEYAPGDRASGEIAWFTAHPGDGWVICAGGVATRTFSTASTNTFTTPDLIGAYAKGAGTYTGAVVPESGSVSGGTTGPESAHTHTVTTADMMSDGANLPAIGATTGSAPFPDPYHLHRVAGQTVTSGAGSEHSHTIGAMAVTGVEPKHVDLLPYFRL